MLDLSFVELLFIAVVSLIVIGPEDLPKVARSIMGFFKQIKAAVSDVKQSVDAMVDETGMQDFKEDMDYILDQNGEYQPVYDISDVAPHVKLGQEEENKDG